MSRLPVRRRAGNLDLYLHSLIFLRKMYVKSTNDENIVGLEYDTNTSHMNILRDVSVPRMQVISI
jgi:hypothetical protein